MHFLLNKKQVFLPIIFFAFYILAACCCRFLTTEHITLAEDWGYIGVCSVLFVLSAGLFGFNQKSIRIFLIFIGFYMIGALTKRFGGMILSEREIVHTFCFATFLYAFYMIFGALGVMLQSKIVKTAVKLLSLLMLLAPMVMVAYYLLNKAVFSSDIMLTLFQTNFNETLSYLKDQNIFAWGCAFVAIMVLLCTLFLSLGFEQPVQKFTKTIWSLSVFYLIFTAYDIGAKTNVHFVYNITRNTYETLKNFSTYNENRLSRLKEIENLKQNVVSPLENGVFVLVIGESETRDHMGAYGYNRPTTPFLQSIKDNENTILFSNAYSNHTHTVPTLSYALSGANQYNNLDFDDAYSILEAAMAGGFETYFISNQPKDSVFLTPLSVMASTAEHQIWLNSAIGDKLSTEYYDEALVDALKKIKPASKSLIIVHMMGSHGAYRDRYPADFKKFEGKGKVVDTYDNSILYTDYVLEKLYREAKKMDHFEAFLYFSDHGDDPDNRLGHESSRFTYRMSRIPLFLIASSDFAKTDIFSILKQNSKAVFTNDLIYNLMLDMMQISGLENNQDLYALSRPTYTLTRHNALTLHGQKRLSDE